MTMYYNTTKVSNPDLKMYVEKARTQDQIVKGIINRINKPFSFKDIYKVYPIQNTPITSIRRTLDTLKKQGFIEETGEKVQGLFNKKEMQLRKK